MSSLYTPIEFNSQHVTLVRDAMFAWLNYLRQSTPPTPTQWQQFRLLSQSPFTMPWIINPDTSLMETISLHSGHIIANVSPKGRGLMIELQTSLFNNDTHIFDEIFNTIINHN
jgi:hypothetical protein